MPGRVIEILTTGTVLNRDRGFMVVKRPEAEPAQVPLSDIACVVVGNGVQLSTNLLLGLQEHGANLIVVGPTYHPASFFWPHSEHGEHTRRLDQQIAASLPLQKRLWQQVVMVKIRNQATVLQEHTQQDEGLSALAKRVGSGDPENLEAQAARRYWQKLMGADFRRNTTPQTETDPNALLNYGYAIMRAATARAISATGLHPALGIYHKNQANTFRLVDDLMEPYRPLVDHQVKQLIKAGQNALTPDTKKKLAGLLDVDLRNHEMDLSPVSVTMLYVAQSFARSLETGEAGLDYPREILPAQSFL